MKNEDHLVSVNVTVQPVKRGSTSVFREIVQEFCPWIPVSVLPISFQ